MSVQRPWLWLFLGAAVLAAAGFAGSSYLKKSASGPAAGAPGASAATDGKAGGPATGAKAVAAVEPVIELAAGDVARARWTELGAPLLVNGSLKAVNSAVLKAKVAAELKSLTVREGERVQAGQLLGVLDSTEFDLRLRQAEEQALSAESQLEIAQRTLDNNKALVNQGFISRNALDTASSTVSGANASLQAARATADIARKSVRDTRIVAPISGLIAQRFVQPGERVSLDARIVEIVDPTRLELEAAVPPEDVVSLRVGQLAAVQVDGLPQTVAAKVVRINPSAQTGTRSVLAYLALDVSPTLRQGLFARATIELQRKRALVVPASAVRYDQAQPYVVVLQDGKARQKRVSTGMRGSAGGSGNSNSNNSSNEAMAEVTSGLAEGDVVLRGTVGALRDGTRLKLQGADSPTPGAAASTAAAPAASLPAGGSAPAAAANPTR